MVIDLEANWQRLNSTVLSIDGIQGGLLYDRQQVERFYLPLAQQVVVRAAGKLRFMAGIAGLPGSGKSTFSALLAAVLQVYLGQTVVVVGMDGWHYTNAYLEGHKLGHLKGSPETFDALAILTCATSIRNGELVSFPCYDRRLHNPVPEAGHVPAGRCIVLLEGNYLLLDEAPWRDFRSLFDLTIFLQVEFEVIQAALLERHLRGGRDQPGAKQQVEGVDLPNARRVLAGFKGADILVLKQDARRISQVEWSHSN